MVSKSRCSCFYCIKLYSWWGYRSKCSCQRYSKSDQNSKENCKSEDSQIPSKKVAAKVNKKPKTVAAKPIRSESKKRN